MSKLTNVLQLLQERGVDKHSLQQSRARTIVWSRDASHYQIEPGMTIRAQSADEIAKILSVANQTSTPVTFRSGGSSLSGQTLGRGVVIDTRSSFGKIKARKENSVISEPGVTLARLNGHLARDKKKVGPDPASMIASTVGGAVSNNSSGMTCGVKYNSYATIKSAKIIFADGTRFSTADEDADSKLSKLKPELYAELISIRDDIRANPEAVEEITRQFSLKNTMGISVNAFIDYDAPVDILLHLLVGSEGTLAFLEEVELETLELNSVKLASLLLFDSLSEANQSLMQIVQKQPAAIELMDSTSLHALNQEDMLPEEIKQKLKQDSAAILVEFEGNELKQVEAEAERFRKSFSSKLVFCGEQGPARDKLWSMRKGLYAVVAKARPVGTTALLEDVVVPPEKLTTACNQLSELCEEFEYGKPVIFGHVRDGNIHFMISDDFSNQSRVQVFEKFTERMSMLILSLGGNLKAEHGTGRAMATYVQVQFGDFLYQQMQRVKKAFDPQGIMNPGVIFPASETEYLENLKQVSQVDELVDSCVECGYCESSCPSAGLTLTPRERIVAFRELQNATGKDKQALKKELHYQADQTCAVDGMCAINCPVGINTGSFIKEIRASNTNRFGKVIGGFIENNWGKVSKLAGNGLKIASKVPGLARQASLLASRIFPKGSAPIYDRHVRSAGNSRKSLVNGEGDFLFLPSCMNEVFGGADLQKISRLSKSKGFTLQVPEGIENFCCGTPFSSKGYKDLAERRAERNTEFLHYTPSKAVIIDGSSCHQTLLGQSPKVMELSEFISENLLDKFEVNKIPRIIIHPTCSGESGSNSAMIRIAHAVAEEVVMPVDWKCCGFAGDRGLLVPELTANATKLETAEVSGLDGVFVSNNQPCQIGLSGSTGKQYQSIVDVWIEAIVED